MSDNKIYNATALQRYLSGQMSEADMHALELAALEDPFLADAIEGYSDTSIPGYDPSADLKDIRRRLKDRIESGPHRRIVPLFRYSWLQIAALVLLLAGSSSIIYYLIHDKSITSDVVVTNKAAAVKPSLTDTTYHSTIKTTDSSLAAIAAIRTRRSEQKMVSNNAVPKYKSRDTNSIVQTQSAPAERTLASTQPDSAPEFIDSEDKVASSPKKRGMQSRQATVSLAETSKKKEEEIVKSEMITQDAMPVMGLSAYNRYLEANKKISGKATDIHGEVTVSFMVSEGGALSDYKIEKSLSKQTDDEAVRLIKEGPAWSVFKNAKAKATIIIKF